MAKIITKNLTATTTVQEVEMNVNEILFCSNDGETGDVWLKFEEDWGANDWWVVKPTDDPEGINLGNMNRVRKVQYKSSVGSIPFRIYGQRKG